MDNEDEQMEQDEMETYLRTSTEEKYNKNKPFEEHNNEGEWMTQFSYLTEEEENALFIVFITGNVENQKTWINAKMNLARTLTNEEIKRREEEVLDRIIPTELVDVDKVFDETFDEEETDDLSKY